MTTTLAHLSPEYAALLGAAAVIGRSFDVDVLACALDKPPLDCLDMLAAMAKGGLVELDGGPDRHRFVDAAAHDAVLDALSASDRVRLHARVADAICTVHADRIDAHLLELAAHWSAAAVGDYREPAARWIARAAEAALGQSAYDDASRLCRRALDVGGDAVDRVDRCQLLLGLATASYRSSDVATAIAACRDAATLAVELGRSDLQAQAALAVEPTLVPEINIELRRLCEEALAAQPRVEPPLRVRVTARLADVCHYLGDLTAAHLACDGLADLAHDCSDDRALAVALHSQQLDASAPDGIDRREQLAHQLLQVATQLCDPTETTWARLWLIDVALQRGDLPRASQELAAATVAGTDGSDVMTKWQLLRANATLAQAQARYEDALRFADEAAALMAATGNPLGGVIWVGQAVNVRFHTGFTPEFAAKIGLADGEPLPDALAASPVQVLSSVVVVTTLERRRDAAAVYRSLGPASDWPTTPHAALFIWVYGILAAIALGENGDLATLHERLGRHAGEHIASGAGCIAYFGPVELWVGKAAAVLGRHDDAVADLEVAVAACAANGAAGFHAQAQLELARALFGRAGTGDAARARALAVTVAERAELLGMRPVATDARALLTDAGSHAGITKRELEVARLVAGGLTNREIAKRLYLSERTAANHVQHVLDKLDLANRSQIATWVSKHDLSSD